MRNKFNYSAVHKNNTRDAVARSVTEQGVKKLREAFDKAFPKADRKEESTGGKQHE
ncbi:hypothetical protein ABRP32_04745 [Providencia manganoxydans]|uniref:hypothetical protein n=1 Tax=Providencia TaxID=586 RepID=UPI00234A3BB6|nr:hypothetical protein [Providencia sp. PROV266]